jgi:hypothetical protein
LFIIGLDYNISLKHNENSFYWLTLMTRKCGRLSDVKNAYVPAKHTLGSKLDHKVRLTQIAVLQGLKLPTTCFYRWFFSCPELWTLPYYKAIQLAHRTPVSLNKCPLVAGKIHGGSTYKWSWNVAIWPLLCKCENKPNKDKYLRSSILVYAYIQLGYGVVYCTIFFLIYTLYLVYCFFSFAYANSNVWWSQVCFLTFWLIPSSFCF